MFLLNGVPANLAGRMAITNGGSEAAKVAIVDYVIENPHYACGLKWATIFPLEQDGVTDAIDFAEDFCVMFTQYYGAHPRYPRAQIPIDSRWYCCDWRGCQPQY